MSSDSNMRDFESFKVPDHEQLWGEPIDREVIDKVMDSPMRTDSRAKAKAYRAAYRMIENDEHKGSFEFEGTTYIVLRTYTKNRTDSDNKTTPTDPAHKSSELRNYISLPGYLSKVDERNMFNLMTPLIEDFEYFVRYEREDDKGNVYFSVAKELPDFSIAEWDDGTSSKNVYILNLFHKREVVRAVTDIKTKTLTETGVHKSNTGTDNNEQTQPVEVSLDALEDDDKPDGFDSWPVEAKVSWANSNLLIEEIVDEVESVSGMDIDRNQSGSPSKKGIAQMYAIIYNLKHDNE